jgi:hypothetical protein
MPSPTGIFQAKAKKASRQPAGDGAARLPVKRKAPPKRPPNPSDYRVGTKVAKDFAGKLFRGEVTEIDNDARRPKSTLYHVLYDDGDEEDLTLNALARVAVAADPGSPPVAKKRARRSSELAPSASPGCSVAGSSPGAIKVPTRRYADYADHVSKDDYQIWIRLSILVAWVDLDRPEACEWHEQGGTIALIAGAVGIPKGSTATIRNVLEDIQFAARSGEKYDPARKAGSGGANKLVMPGTATENLIADHMEAGHGIKQTTAHVNEWRVSQGMMHLGESAVYSAHLRMEPDVTPIGNRKQGAFDSDTPWAKARYGWVIQLLTRLRQADMSLPDLKAAGLVKDTATQIPAMFDKGKLTPLSLKQIAFWDETHKKCILGDVGGHGLQIRYKRGADGMVDKENGTLADQTHQVKAKYENEVRFCIGVANIDGVGTRLPAFSYTGKKVVTRKVFDEAWKKAISDVKGGDSSAHWVKSGRAKGSIYGDDPITKLRGIKDKRAEKWGMCNIRTIGDLQAARAGVSVTPRVAAALKQVGIGADKEGGYLAAISNLDALTYAGATAPVTVDHRKSTNPFKSRAESEGRGGEWEADIRKHGEVGKLACIEDMVTHMMTATAAAYEGTEHEQDWMIYHDALALMTAGPTRDWMAEQKFGDGSTYLDHWILPEHDLNAGTTYAGRPPGNSPELMPMDAYLNRDLHECVARHILATYGMDQELMVEFGDKQIPQRFSGATPKHLEQAYLRIWDPTIAHPATNGCPCSRRILEDINRFKLACDSIAEEQGAVVHMCSLRNGHRDVASGKGAGGSESNKKKAAPDATPWLHEHARGHSEKFTAQSLQRHASRL